MTKTFWEREGAAYLMVLLIAGWWAYDLHFHWHSIPEYQFGWIVLLLAAYLAWERWPSRPQSDTPASLWVCGFVLLIGTPLVLVAELYRYSVGRSLASSFSLSFGCLLFIFAILLYGRGKATWRHFLFPLLFFLIAVPPPRIIWNPVVLGLQGMITVLNVETLSLLGIPALRQANVIQLPNCVVGVDEACSGVRSLQSSIMAALFIGSLTLRRSSFRIVFVLISILLALTGNYVRSVYLSLTAYRQGTEALEKMHDAAGWGILLFTAGGLIAVGWAMARMERRIDGLQEMLNSRPPPSDATLESASRRLD